MSIVETIKSVAGLTGDDVDTTTYECQDCFATHESAKIPERAQCPECLSNNVEPVDGE